MFNLGDRVIVKCQENIAEKVPDMVGTITKVYSDDDFYEIRLEIVPISTKIYYVGRGLHRMGASITSAIPYTKEDCL